MSNLSTAQRLEASEKSLSEITGQLTAANIDLAAVRAELETAKGTIAANECTISGLNKSVTDLTASLNTATAELTTVKGENETLKAKEQDIEKRATAKAAAVVGVVGATAAPLPITTSKNAGGNSVSKLTLGEFNSLSQIEKNKFMSSGGKLSE